MARKFPIEPNVCDVKKINPALMQAVKDGLSLNQFAILRALVINAPTPLSLEQLTEATTVNTFTVNNIVSKFDLIEKKRHATGSHGRRVALWGLKE